MVDFLSKRGRSSLMSRIRSHGNAATELRFVRLLKAARITGWRRHYPLFGKPDFTFPKERLVVFVDGCFWHGCLRCCREPKSNRLFWRRKIVANRERARLVNAELRHRNWRVMRLWQHELTVRNEPKVRGRLLLRLRTGHSR
jgi:DNA mismatch endonuclease (patch repair protein)